MGHQEESWFTSSRLGSLRHVGCCNGFAIARTSSNRKSPQGSKSAQGFWKVAELMKKFVDQSYFPTWRVQPPGLEELQNSGVPSDPLKPYTAVWCMLNLSPLTSLETVQGTVAFLHSQLRATGDADARPQHLPGGCHLLPAYDPHDSCERDSSTVFRRKLSRS